MNTKRNSDLQTSDGDNSGASTSQLPEWHPFAVWQNEIRSHQTSQTGQHQIIRPSEIAEV